MQKVHSKRNSKNCNNDRIQWYICTILPHLLHLNPSPVGCSFSILFFLNIVLNIVYLHY